MIVSNVRPKEQDRKKIKRKRKVMLKKIPESEPITLENFLNLNKMLDSDFVCKSVVINDNNSPLRKPKYRLDENGNLVFDGFENVYDENGELIYPINLDNKNVDIVLWNGNTKTLSISDLIDIYGDKLVINSNYRFDEETNIAFHHITIEKN
jgi:hypothetical protein